MVTTLDDVISQNNFLKNHIFLLLLSVFLYQAFPQQILIDGVCTYVIDGDTISVKSSGEGYRIRLAYIDAPEISQYYGDFSRKTLTDFLLYKKVSVKIINKDMYNRYVGVVIYNDESVNIAMVNAGAAWAYKGFCPAKYYAAQFLAAYRKKGLWHDNNPIAPWIFRKGME